MFKKLAVLVLCGSVLASQATFIPLISHAHGRDTFDTLSEKPAGKIVKIGGVDTYVTLPRQRSSSKAAVLYLSDVFGLPLVNNKLTADSFARAGFATYAMDYLNGDPAPIDDDPNFNFTAWLVNHQPQQTLPPVRAVISALRASGVREFAVSGYCFGGLYTILLTQTNEVKVGSTAHPSLLTVPDDFEVIQADSTVPLEIHSAELDTALTPALAEVVDETMEGYQPGYRRFFYEGVGHGFAVRPANASDPAQVAARAQANARAAAWFRQHL